MLQSIYQKEIREEVICLLSQQFQVFLRVAECGSFTRAAKQLLVTPASVMKHINALEDRLGVTLFTRDKKGVTLTAAGRSLYQDGKKLASMAQSAAGRARQAEQAVGVTIRVGSSLLNPSRVLTDLWEPLRSAYPQYRFRIVPYTDTKEERFAVIGALGERFDLLVGAFDSKETLSRANYLVLGYHKLCVAVPRAHPLAAKEKLEIQDLYGERLVKVKRGETERLDRFQEELQRAHPQILIEETDYYYDVDTFNACEQSGALLLTLDAWADVHPSLVTLPVAWEYQIPCGILYARQPSPDTAQFLSIVQKLCAPPQ